MSLSSPSVDELVRQVNVLLGHYQSDDVADYDLLGAVHVMSHADEVHAILTLRVTPIDQEAGPALGPPVPEDGDR